MLFISSGIFYSKVQFKTEGVVEKVVVDNFKLLFGGYSIHFDYGPKGKPKTHFEGVVRSDGIEVDGVVSSASISAMRCIQKINPTRTTANGWAIWKTVDGKLLEEKWNALLKMNGEQVKSSGKKPHKKKSHKAPDAKPAEIDDKARKKLKSLKK